MNENNETKAFLVFDGFCDFILCPAKLVLSILLTKLHELKGMCMQYLPLNSNARKVVNKKNYNKTN